MFSTGLYICILSISIICLIIISRISAMCRAEKTVENIRERLLLNQLRVD